MGIHKHPECCSEGFVDIAAAAAAEVVDNVAAEVVDIAAAEMVDKSWEVVAVAADSMASEADTD